VDKWERTLSELRKYMLTLSAYPNTREIKAAARILYRDNPNMKEQFSPDRIKVNELLVTYAKCQEAKSEIVKLTNTFEHVQKYYINTLNLTAKDIHVSDLEEGEIDIVESGDVEDLFKLIQNNRGKKYTLRARKCSCTCRDCCDCATEFTITFTAPTDPKIRLKLANQEIERRQLAAKKYLEEVKCRLEQAKQLLL
jgi:hypothetical protein